MMGIHFTTYEPDEPEPRWVKWLGWLIFVFNMALMMSGVALWTWVGLQTLESLWRWLAR
jgi:hypothetical protein